MSRMLNAQELKRLETRREQLQAERLATGRAREKLALQEHDQETELRRLQEQMDRLGTDDQPVIVTEHAMLRFLQRVKGLDLEALQKEIIDDHSEQIKKLRHCKIKRRDGVTLVIKNASVISVVKD